MSSTDTIIVAQPPEQLSRPAQGQPAKTRRAFVACVLCRDRKIKCVIAANANSCQQCIESGSKCIIKKRGVKRRRSNHDTEQMDRRLEVLESLLSQSTAPPMREDKVFPTLALHGPSGNRASPQANSDKFPITTQNNSHESRAFSQPAEGEVGENLAGTKTLSQGTIQNNTEDSILSRLLAKTGRLNADAGRLRYFGPTTNLYIYDTYNNLSASLCPSFAEQEASRMIEGLPGETHAYILEQYWKFYNSVIEVVPKEPWLEGHSTDNNELYSVFLHLTMLAIGLRYADKERSDIIKFVVSPYESIFHRQAKLLFESELERGGRLPAIQALLLLSDLECGSGKDMMGWMYAGMANRLFFDLGLNLNSVSLGLSSWEAEVRQKVSIALLMIDRCWSLFFVRPTCVKKSDLEATSSLNPAARFDPEGADGKTKQQPIIYEAAKSLMEIGSKVGDSNATRTSEVDSSSHMTMLILHGEVERWYKGLHQAITWEADNIQNAIASFFLLHQQYHAIRIMLHRPFIDYTDASNANGSLTSNLRPSFLPNSYDVCLESGLQLARIFNVSRSQFNIRQSFITAMQHTGTGITALMEVIARTNLPEQRREPMRHLLCLKSVLSELGHVYQHASRMHRVVDIVLDESGWEAEYLAIEKSMHAQNPIIPVSPMATHRTAVAPVEPTSAGSKEITAETAGNASDPTVRMHPSETQEMWNFSHGADWGEEPVAMAVSGVITDIDLIDWFQLEKLH